MEYDGDESTVVLRPASSDTLVDPQIELLA